jgi:hypothetical protein
MTLRSDGWLKAVRWVLLALALFDLTLAIAFTFLADRSVAAIGAPAYAEPLFFQRCVGVFLFQYVFVQYLGFLDPRRWATTLTMTVAVRATFAIMYLTELALWGGPFSTLHALFLASSVLDAATTVFLLVAMRRLGIGVLGGDTVAPPGAPSSRFLRGMLAVMSIGQLFIGLGWLLAPKLLCDLCGIGFTVDPFWARATGLFLVHIGFIMFLGSRDPNRYRSAVLTSGLFGPLWPLLYWYSVADGVGTPLFRIAIMCFSFFDIATGVVIFALVHRMSAQSRTLAQPAPQGQA